MEANVQLSYKEEVVPIDKLKKIDEFKQLIPPNNMKEEIKNSISKNGQTLPIDTDDEYVILDGYTRVEILEQLGFNTVKIRKWNFKALQDKVTAYKLIAMLNLQRRHLDKNEVLKLIREIAEKMTKLEQQTTNKTNNNQEEKKVDYQSLKKAKEEIGAKDISEQDLQRYSKISEIPFLRELVDNSKISIRTAYNLYTKAKDKLEKISTLPKYERELLVTTREGRKILEERDDILQDILQHKIAVSQAINKIKAEEKSKTSEDKEEKKEERTTDTRNNLKEEIEYEEIGEEEEPSDIREDEYEDEEEYDFKGEWEKISEESQIDIGIIIQEQLSEKGFIELPSNVVFIKLNGKCYAISSDSLRQIEQGSNKWEELRQLLKDVILPGEEEGLYVVPWKFFSRCNEWNSDPGKKKS